MPQIDLAELRRLLSEIDLTGDGWISRSMIVVDALPSLLDELEAAREALSQIYWKSIDLGEDRGDSTINHIAGDALKGDTSPLDARDRRMKAIGAAEELERFATAKDLKGMPGLIQWSMRHRAAQLRREAEGEKDGQK